MSFVKTRFFRSVAICLVFSFFFVALIPKNSYAYIAAAEEMSSTRQTDEATVQRILESKAVSERLESFGLSAEEVDSKVSRLSDSELHSFASNLESVATAPDIGTQDNSRAGRLIYASGGLCRLCYINSAAAGL